MFVHGTLVLSKTCLLYMFVGKVGRGRVKPLPELLKHYEANLGSDESQPMNLIQQTQINTTPSYALHSFPVNRPHTGMLF